MKKIYLLLFAVLAVLQLSAQDRVTQIREKLMNRDQSSVIVVAHRGDWRNFPENSLEAIDNAVRMGVDIVELDVKKTKDGELILMHDRALDRQGAGFGSHSRLHTWVEVEKRLQHTYHPQSSYFGRGLAACQRQDNDKSGPGRPLFRPDL